MDFQHIGVIGAGIMGSGIAQVCAMAGLHVTMVDTSQEAADRGARKISDALDRLVHKGKLSATDKAQMLSRLQTSTDYEEFSDAQLVIEAAAENPALKLRILKQVEDTVAEEAVIATNTSSISVTQLAAVLARPERFIGMHFFNPVVVMPLLELVRGLQTSDETHAKALSFASTVGKTPVSVRNGPGFMVNRVLCPMINEAIFCLQEGLTSAQGIDEGMKLGCSHPIGPLALADLIGLDTLLAIMDVLHEGFGDPKYRAAPLLREMVEAGRLGRKSGQGFYAY